MSKQLEIEINGARYLLCEVPKKAFDFSLLETDNILRYWVKYSDFDSLNNDPIPEGKYSIIGFAYDFPEFAEAIKTNGIETVNKYGDKSKLLQYEGKISEWLEMASQWQEAQSQIWQKILILKID